MRKLTKAEISNCIGYKSLLIARDRQGKIVRVSSPVTLIPWEFDGNTWCLKANMKPVEHNRNGIYVTFNSKTAGEYLGSKCKVILSGAVVIHEDGARGEFARLLEVPCVSAKSRRW
jgi:hypothetical protein